MSSRVGSSLPIAAALLIPLLLVSARWRAPLIAHASSASTSQHATDASPQSPPLEPGVGEHGEPATAGHEAGSPGHETGSSAHETGADAHHAPVGHVTTESFWHTYLLSFCFFASLPLGALFFILLGHLTKAGWSVVVRRLAEGVLGTFPLVALFALPLLLPDTTHALYAWAGEQAGDDPLIATKAAYLNHTAFAVRLVLYLMIWTGLAFFFRRESLLQDSDGDVAHTLRMQKVAPFGMILYAISITLFAFDSLMSLDAHWFSTIFGVIFFSGSMLAFMAVLAVLSVTLQRFGWVDSSISAEHYQDIGKLLFAFIVFWAYTVFSQYMLIWYGNIPEETGWYLRRQATDSWVWLSAFLAVGHFGIPFFFLLSRHIKRNPAALTAGSLWMLAMHWLDLYYLVMPQVRSEAPPHMLDFALFAGMGVIFFGVLLVVIRRNPRIAARDPRLPESLAFENY